MSDGCEHRDTDTYIHTDEDGNVSVRIYCIGCDAEVG